MRELPQKPSKLLYQSEIVWIGRFRSKPHQPPFQGDKRIGTGHLIVFPRTAVKIEPAGYTPVVANPNVTMLYNKGQIYRRSPISQEGDRCEWFGFATQLLIEALQSADPSVIDHADQPFTNTHLQCESSLYLRQRQLVEQIMAWSVEPSCAAEVDTLFIEEQALTLLHAISQHVGDQSPTRLKSHHVDLVYAAQEFLSRHFNQPTKLHELANALAVSPFHLARLFKRQTCQTIHQYRERLRLHTALELLPYYRKRLTELALYLGYANHSHFTSVFRRAYGVTPSAV